MPTCFVPACKTRDKTKPRDISFHRFPHHMKKVWLKILGQDPNLQISHTTVICSKHFNSDDFDKYGERRRLKKDAVPTLNITSCVKKLDFKLTATTTTEIVAGEQSANLNEVTFNTVVPESKTCDFVFSKPSTSYTETVVQECEPPVHSPTEPKSIDVLKNSDSENEIRLKNFLKRKRIKEHESSSTSDNTSTSSSPPLKRKKFYRNMENISLTKYLKKCSTSKKTSDTASTDSSTSVKHKNFKDSPTTSSVERRRNNVKFYHNYSHSPSYQLKKLNKAEETVCSLKKKLKCANTQKLRLKKKVLSLNAIINDLKKNHAMSENALDSLENSISGIPMKLMKRLMMNTRYGKKVRTKYPPELRSFAMTLQFYSPKAYEYVRRTFNHALPHQSVIRSWFSKIDCEPGFSAPAFSELRCKVEDQKKKNNSYIYCSLMLDEMAIKKHIEFDGKKIRGYEDFGADIPSDECEEATEALVIMVVAINGSWKIPVAYFLIKKLSGDERAELVKETLKRLHKIGIKIVSLTCDGPQVHIKMMNSLGCNVTNMLNLKTWFEHPIDKSKIYVIFDVCHMLKLVRNNWARLKQFKDPDGNIVDWTYIENLYELQEEQMFNFGNKLRRSHIEWKKQVMKVKLAAHTLSASVADALEFLGEDIKLSKFQHVSATVKFIRLIDQLFDMLNSRNPFAKGFKGPLRKANEKFWKPFFHKAMEYLKKCTTIDNSIPMHKTVNKTPFIGFIVSSNSMLSIADDYLSEDKLKYILSYKFSQDHLELFFCNVRCRNGWNNNPTALQFIRTYKRLLLHHDVKNITGNCLPQDNTNILNVSSSLVKLNYSDVSYQRKNNIECTDNLDLDIIDIPKNLSDLAVNVVTYISGYVVKMLKKKIFCVECKTSLEENAVPQDDNGFKLLRRKQRGGLQIPSKDVVKICTYVEKRIRNILEVNSKKLPSMNLFVEKLIHSCTSYFLLFASNIFQNADNHIFNTAVEEDSHKKKLIQLTVSCYVRIRLFSLGKLQTQSIQGKHVRTPLSRLVIFSHQ